MPLLSPYTLLFLFLSLLSVADAQPAPPPIQGCPLFMQRPKYEELMRFQIEPLIILMEDVEERSIGKKAYAKFKSSLGALGTAMKQWNQLMMADPKTSQEEIREASEKLSLLMVSFLIDNKAVIEGEKLSNDLSANETLKSAMVHLMRSLYVSNEDLRNASVTGSLALNFPREAMEIVNRFKSLWKLEMELKEERFVKKACKFIEQEREEVCRAPIGMIGGMGLDPSAQVVPLQQQRETQAQQERAADLFKAVEKKLGEGLKLWNQEVAQQSWLARMTGDLRKTQRAHLSNDWRIEEGFDTYVAPLIKMCGIYMALQNYERRHQKLNEGLQKLGLAPTYEKACSPFLCPKTNLLQNGAGKEEALGSFKASFCHYASEYPQMEEAYFNGFKQYVTERKNINQGMEYSRPEKKVSFCPQNPKAARPRSQPHATDLKKHQ